MGIDVEGDSNRGVAKTFRYDSGMHVGAQQRCRVRVSQDTKAVLGSSPAPRQTPGKRTPRHSAVLGTTRRYSGPDSHAQDGTQRHLAVPANTLVDAFARRRSAVRTRCGPPSICRDFLPSWPSARLPKRPSATHVQPQSVRLDAPCWGRLVPGGPATVGGDRLTGLPDARAVTRPQGAPRREPPSAHERPTVRAWTAQPLPARSHSEGGTPWHSEDRYATAALLAALALALLALAGCGAAGTHPRQAPPPTP